MNADERGVDGCGSYAGAWAFAIRGIQISNGTKKYRVYLCIKPSLSVFLTSKVIGECSLQKLAYATQQQKS
jgi:hypothetical protein